MPRLSVWMVRTALLYFGVGLFFSGLLLFNKGLPFSGDLWRLLPVHIELLMFGWMMQLAMGVAFWILPRFATEPRYGRIRLVQATFVFLNSGVISTAYGLWAGQIYIAWMGRMLILAAVVCFAVYIFPRIKPFAETKPD